MTYATKEFQVLIKGLKISEANAKRIDYQIRRAVPNKIATLDLNGDYIIKDLRNMGQTRGLVFDERSFS
jgi:hypothetical protein